MSSLIKGDHVEQNQTLPHSVYVWQHSWDEATHNALMLHAKEFATLAILAAELNEQQGELKVTRIAYDAHLLHTLDKPIALTFRLNSVPKLLPSYADTLTDVIQQSLRRANLAGIRVKEIQLDYDAPSSKLSNYRDILKQLQARIAPIPLVITALPAWLDTDDFQNLLPWIEYFVLQVHSVNKGHADVPRTLFNSEQAWSSVVKAYSFGKAFVVALPTYAYRIAYTESGEVAALAGESTPYLANTLPWEELRANPHDIALLVQKLRQASFGLLKGIIWYRFPIATDRLNWRWPTLRSVMQGIPPKTHIKVWLEATTPGLYDIKVSAEGDDDSLVAPIVHITWEKGRLVAVDALADYQTRQTDPQTLLFFPNAAPRNSLWLSVGQQRVIGWLRLSQPTKVTAYVED